MKIDLKYKTTLFSTAPSKIVCFELTEVDTWNLKEWFGLLRRKKKPTNNYFVIGENTYYLDKYVSKWNESIEKFK